MSSSKVIVLGLDGATFEIIDPLIQVGALPNIGDLIRHGCRRILQSTIPYVTMPAWPSFMTGKNPGKLGVFDFFVIDPDGQRRIANSTDVRSETLWEILGSFGKASIVMNVPGTYPPKDINGILVSGMLTPPGAPFTAPPEVRTLLDELTGGYRVNEDASLVSRQSGEELLSDLLDVAQKQSFAFRSLLQSRPWDFAAIVFRASDIIQHLFWDAPLRVSLVYRFLDHVVGEIRALYPDALLLIMSDHGAQGHLRTVHVNQWLIDHGFMSIAKRTLNEPAHTREAGSQNGDGQRMARAGSARHAWGIRKLAAGRTITKADLRRRLPAPLWSLARWVIPRRWKAIVPARHEYEHEIDWGHTRVSASQDFCLDSRVVRINLRGRDPQGIVPPSEYEALRREVAEGLRSLKDPETSKLVIKACYVPEDLYWGPYVDRAPDIVLDLNDGYQISRCLYANEWVTKKSPTTGYHHRDGILVVQGPGVREGAELGPASILDLTPTILNYSGVPVPSDCDGKVLADLFSADSDVKERQPQFLEPLPASDVHGLSVGPSGDMSQVEERLRALGYLD